MAPFKLRQTQVGMNPNEKKLDSSSSGSRWQTQVGTDSVGPVEKESLTMLKNTHIYI